MSIPKFLLTFPLALLTAALVWLLAVAAPVLLGIALGVPVMIGMAVLGLDLDRHLDWLTPLLILLAAVAVSGFVTVLPLRFGLRLAPLPIGEAGRGWLPPALIGAWLGVLGVFILMEAEWITVVFTILVGLAGLWRLWAFRRAWTGLPPAPSVLFLRRFGQSGDRLVSTAMRQALPEHATLVFLLGGRQGGDSWDPLLISFEGAGTGWEPKAAPVYLQTTDEEWVDRVRALIDHSAAIVFDATDWSDAMATEANLIQQAGAEDKTIVLMRGEAPLPAALSGRQVIRYRKSWRQARSRIGWGLLLLVVAPQAIAMADTERELPYLWPTILLVLLWGWLLVRPLMDGGALEGLKQELRAVAGKETDEDRK